MNIYHLPQDILSSIYSYDDTYREEFKYCLIELIQHVEKREYLWDKMRHIIYSCNGVFTTKREILYYSSFYGLELKRYWSKRRMVEYLKTIFYDKMTDYIDL